ncbi:MAG TPA: CBS domain-containing protein [Saprospiraceae bacterium]|nr:CBS domain-containing protein [Saprospiraceae bacterium]
MVAESLISTELIPLQTSDFGATALEMMSEFYVRHLPIVNNTQLLGLISEDDILEYDVNEAIGSYSLSLARPYVYRGEHLYEVMRILAEKRLTVIPVVDKEHNYMGVVTLDDLLQYFSGNYSFREPGSIIVLTMSNRDYSLAEIARIVESENARILSAFVTSQPNSPIIDVTLKLNKQHTQNIIATFLRFDYQVKASFNEVEYLDSLQERYDSLMSYLNV